MEATYAVDNVAAAAAADNNAIGTFHVAVVFDVVDVDYMAVAVRFCSHSSVCDFVDYT